MILDIIIVNYNVKHYLAQCLTAVEQAIVDVDAAVWVVDNASHDGSLNYLRPLFPWVHFVQSSENVGFSRANNLAIRQSHGKYVLLLNPDTIVTSKTIKDCIRLLDEHPEIGSTGVSMYNADGTYARESKRAIPTAKVSFYKMSGLGSLFPRHKEFAKYHLGYLDANEAHEIEIISGAFNMMRREALDQVGLLDEDFFMYGEDIDLSYRMLKGGWKNWYLPSPMLHYKGESAHSSTFRYVNVFYQAMIIFYDKHFGGRFSLSACLIRFAVYFKALITLCMHFLRYIRNKFLIKPSPDVAYVVGDEVSEDLKSLFLQKGITLTSTPDHADFMVFTYGVFTYDKMIELLLNQEDKHRLQLGIYYEDKKMLILPIDVHVKDC